MGWWGAARQTEPCDEGWASRIETRGGRKYVWLLKLGSKRKVREEWARLCKRKLASFEDFSAGGFYLFGFLSSSSSSFFLQNSIDFSGRIFFFFFVFTS